MNVAAMAGLRLHSRLDLSKVWPDFLVWLAVSVATLGWATLGWAGPRWAGLGHAGPGWLLVAGHFFRAVITSCEVVGADGQPLGRLVCDYDVEKRTGELARCLVLCIATLGVGLLSYSFHAARAALDHTRVEWY